MEQKSGKFPIIKCALKIFCSILLIALTLLALPPVLIGYPNPGSAAGILAGSAILFFLWRPGLREKLRAGKLRGIYLFCLALFWAGTGAAVILSGLMAAAALNRPPDKPQTVIVLGCRVNGTTPSLMLAERLNAALQYLEEHPEAACIVSGGQGPDEQITEAAAMRSYLLQRGISDDRILTEEKSENTAQNLRYSAEILKAGGLPSDVAVVTDSFHQFRGQREAKKQGLAPSAVNARTPWYMYESYFLRELMAVVKSLVLGGVS